MISLIDKYRQKSEKEKKATAFLISFFITGVIFVVWFSAFWPKIFGSSEVSDKKFNTPKDSLTAIIISAFDDVKNQTVEMKNNLKDMDFTSDVEYKSIDKY
jgi:hypothetical protein